MTTHCLIFQNKFFLFNPPQAIFIPIQAFCNIYFLSQALFLYLPHPTLNFKFHLTFAPFITVYSLFPRWGFGYCHLSFPNSCHSLNSLFFHFSPFPIPFSHFSLHLTTFYLRKIIGNIMIQHIPCLLNKGVNESVLEVSDFSNSVRAPTIQHLRPSMRRNMPCKSSRCQLLKLIFWLWNTTDFILFTVLATAPVKSINVLL